MEEQRVTQVSSSVGPETQSLPNKNESELGTLSRSESLHGVQDKTRLTIVVPCFNEEPVLPFLRDTLSSAQQLLGKTYDLQIILVDDGSTDRTWPVLQQLFESRSEFRLLRHASNLGISAAILTGIRAAETEIVCSIDSDCSYDPHELEKLVPMLTSGVDLVTGSPYHPLGKVERCTALAPWSYRKWRRHYIDLCSTKSFAHIPVVFASTGGAQF